MVTLACVLITIEALRAPVGFTPFHGIPRIFDRIGAEPHPVLAEFPVYYRGAISRNGPYLLDDTEWFEPVINGYSGFETAGFQERGRILSGFPDTASIALLRQIGVTLVAVHTAAWDAEHLTALATVQDLQLIADEDGIRLYRLR